jgi:hypothetical protein
MKRKSAVLYPFWMLPEGERLKQHHSIACRTALPEGCDTANLSDEHLHALRRLSDNIISRLPKMVPWGDGWYDNKKRGYAMLPEHSQWQTVEQIACAGIRLHDVDAQSSLNSAVRKDAVGKHQQTMEKAFITISPTEDELAALACVVNRANAIVQKHRDTLQPYEVDAVSLSNLVAIQPNVHNGDDYLPLHLDNPRHDGFGVVIVTVALWGTADIVLVDDGDPDDEEAHRDAEAGPPPGGEAAASVAAVPKVCSPEAEGTGTVVDEMSCAPQALEATGSNGAAGVAQQVTERETGGGSESWVFTLQPGQLYVLSGRARNKCAHGVVVLPEVDSLQDQAYAQNVREHSVRWVGGKKTRRAKSDVRQRHTAAAAVSAALDRPGPVAAVHPLYRPERGRVSLNLRFGLHSEQQAREEVDRHWL